MSDAAILYAALHNKAGAELLNETITGTQLRFMVRVKKGQQTTLWLSIVDHLLTLGDAQLSTGKPVWTIDISKQYFRRPELKFSWRVILQIPKEGGSAALKEVCEQLALSVNAAQVTVQNLLTEEVALQGNPNRKGGRMTPY